MEEITALSISELGGSAASVISGIIIRYSTI